MQLRHRFSAGAAILCALMSTACSLALSTDIVPPTTDGGGTSNAVASRCQTVGPDDNSNLVRIGAILPVEGDFASIGQPMRNAIELAVVEINELGGLGNGQLLAVEVCDSSGSIDQGVEVANYLVSSVGVPLIIGPAFSGIFIDVSTRVTVPAGVMTLSPSATSPSISDLDDMNLAWRTVPSDTFQGVAMVDLVRLRNYRRVIALGKGDAYGRGLLREVNRLLGVELMDSFYSVEYEDPGAAANPTYSSQILESLQNVSSAEVILLLGTNEVADIMRLFEAEFERTGTSTSARPQYLFADGGKVSETLAEIDAEPSLLNRVEGTEPDLQGSPLYVRFALDYQGRYRDPPGIFTTSSYDAVYLAAYGILRSSTNPPTGASMAAGMSSLITGTAIDAGQAAFGQARTILSSGGSIDFNGVSGPLNFDLQSGEAPANIALWRVGRRSTTGELRFEPAGRYTVGSDGTGSWEF